jgi:Zn-dependent M28 family amino/carboxypeptidase
VAGLIELALALAAQPPARPVELVAYTLEEPPFFRSAAMGSMQHARALHEAGTEVALMISLEMIGTFSDAPGSQRYPVPGLSLIYPDQGNFIAIVSRVQDIAATRALKASMRGATPLPVRSINAPPALVGVDFSDHLSYWTHGYPAVMVTDTAFYRNEHYHQPTDTADRLDYRRMAQVVEGVAAFALRPRH